MLIAQLQPTVIELITKIAAAEVVRVDEGLFVITKKSEQLDPQIVKTEKVEDHEAMFQTDYHIFNWWELANDSTKLNDREWKVGENILSFFTLQPS